MHMCLPWLRFGHHVHTILVTVCQSLLHSSSISPGVRGGSSFLILGGEEWKHYIAISIAQRDFSCTMWPCGPLVSREC